MRTLFIALSLSLAACAGPIETRIENSGVAPVAPATFQFDPEAYADAKALVGPALEQRGFKLVEAGALNVQVTVAERSAQLALQEGKAILSPAAGKKLCAEREYRLGITLTRISDGLTIYRANAAEFHCKETLAEVLPVLVNSALTDLGAPRGQYVVKRPRR